MPLPYLSFSAFDLYQRDPIEFYQQYFVCRVDRATAKMTLGKIFQEAWSDPKYDYKKALKSAGFTSNYERIVRTALEHPRTVRLPKNKCEKKYIVKGRGLAYPIMGVFDGDDVGKKTIIENKFGAVWSQDTVTKHKQITWYMLVNKIKRGYMPKFLLQSYNAKNGIPKHYWAKRYEFDLDKLVQEINTMVARVQAGDFEKH